MGKTKFEKNLIGGCFMNTLLSEEKYIILLKEKEGSSFSFLGHSMVLPESGGYFPFSIVDSFNSHVKTYSYSRNALKMMDIVQSRGYDCILVRKIVSNVS